MFQKLRQFQSWRDVGLFLHILLLWICLPVLLWLPLHRVLRLLTPRRQLTPRNSAASDSQRQKVIRFANYWFSRKSIAARNTCLKRSLILYYFLNRGGAAVKICLGVKKENGRLTGHSWLEGAGWTADRLPEFVVIYRYPE